MTEDEFEADDMRMMDEEMMAAFRALPFEERVLPGAITQLNGVEIITKGDPLMALEAHDPHGNPICYEGHPIKVVRVDGHKYPVRLTMRLETPKDFAGDDCCVLFHDSEGNDPAMLLHEKFHIYLRHE